MQAFYWSKALEALQEVLTLFCCALLTFFPIQGKSTHTGNSVNWQCIPFYLLRCHLLILEKIHLTYDAKHGDLF